MDLQRQYQIAKERAERFVRANGLKPLWEGQSNLDVVCMWTDIYERGLSIEERAHRAVLRVEWLARVKTPPLDGVQFGYRK